MTLPSVIDSTVFNTAAAATSFNIPVPSNIAGDVMILCAVTDSGANLTEPAGFNILRANQSTGSSGAKGSIWYKVSGGSEGANYTYTLDVSERTGAVCFSVRNASGTITVIGTDLTGTSAASATVPSITTTAADSLRISVVFVDYGTNTAPHGVATGHDAKINEASVSSGGTVSAHRKNLPTAGLDGTATVSFSASDDWRGIAFALNPGSTLYTQILSGTITSSGNLTKKATKVFEGSVSSSGNLLRLTRKLLTGTVASSSTLLKITTKKLAGTVSSSGILNSSKTFLKILAGTVGSSGTLLRRTTKLFSGNITPTGSLLKRINKLLAGTVSSTGTLSSFKIYVRILSGTVSSSGQLLKKTTKLLGGTIVPTGSLLKLTRKILAGTVSLNGTLVRLREKVKDIFLKYRGTFSSNDLSFTIQVPPWGVDNYSKVITQDVTSYEHSYTALGGFWSANISLKVPLVELEEWINNGVGREIKVKGRATSVVFEGIVNRISLEVSGYSISIGPYMDISNKVKITYSSLVDLGDGTVTGIRSETSYIEDISSQQKYGVLIKNFSAGGISESYVTELQTMLLDRYKNPLRSEDLNIPGSLDSKIVDLKLECVGYIHLMQKYLYNSTTTGLQFLSVKLKNIIEEEPNFVFSHSVEENQLEVPAFENDDNEAWGLVKSLVTLGDSNFFRYVFGCYENRKIIYRSVVEDVIYYRPFREGTGTLLDRLGGSIQPWQVRPGIYIMVSDIFPGKPLPSDITSDMRIIYVETVQFRMPNSLVINGAHYFKVDQKLAQLGIKGIG